MREGILLYIAQGKSCDEQQLERFIRLNGLSGVPIAVAGEAENTPSFYEAYRSLGSKGADVVECFSARINDKGGIEILRSNITLPAGIDLLKFCRPEELGLTGEAAQRNT